MYYTATLEFSSESTTKSVLIKNPARGAKGKKQKALPGYNSPSPTFSIETLGP